MHGIAKIEIGDCGADGIIGTVLEEIKAFVKDSVLFDVGEPETVDIEIEGTDEPDIFAISKGGPKMLTFGTRDLKPENLALFLGGKVVAGETFTAESTTPVPVYQSVKITSEPVDGKYMEIEIPKAAVYAKNAGALQKSESGILEVSCRIMTPFDATDTALSPYKITYVAVT